MNEYVLSPSNNTSIVELLLTAKPLRFPCLVNSMTREENSRYQSTDTAVAESFPFQRLGVYLRII